MRCTQNVLHITPSLLYMYVSKSCCFKFKWQMNLITPQLSLFTSWNVPTWWMATCFNTPYWSDLSCSTSSNECYNDQLHIFLWSSDLGWGVLVWNHCVQVVSSGLNLKYTKTFTELHFKKLPPILWNTQKYKNSILLNLNLCQVF